jgi:hypothetical protein
LDNSARRIGALLLVLAGLLAGRALAQSVTASQILTIPTTATGLTGVAGSTFCRGLLEGGNIRMALDGGTATATVGRPVYVGERIHLNNAQDVARFSAIATTTTPTTIAMYCGSGTTPTISEIITPTVNTALPLCNGLTRPAGNCR